VIVYLDADILIWHLRGLPAATALLLELMGDPAIDVWTGCMQRAEVTFHLRASEKAETEKFMGLIRSYPVTERIVDMAAEIYRTWHPSHGTDPNDAILAATAVLTNGLVVTQNVKHFPMLGQACRRGWE